MTKRINESLCLVDEKNIFGCECKRLDDYLDMLAGRHIHLLKLDVEGEELDVLRSAENILAEERVDVLYLEVGFNRAGTQQTYFAALDEFLQDLHYRVFRIYEQKNEWIDNSPLLRRCNFAYMSSRFAATHPYQK